jgi:hypothetical protein
MSSSELPFHRIHKLDRRNPLLSQVGVRDLCLTYGRCLRDTGVSEEGSGLLLGHASNGMLQHYAAAIVGRLLEVASTVLKTHDRATVHGAWRTGEITKNRASPWSRYELRRPLSKETGLA